MLLTEFHDVSSLAPVVRAGIQHLANEVDAKATDLGFVRPKGDVRFGLIERIEFPSVVADFNVEAVFRNLQVDNDLMLPGVVVAVFDGIGHDFLNGEVGGENDAFGCFIALEKLRRCVGRRGEIIEIAIDLEDDIGHGRKVSDAEDRSQLFAQDEAGARNDTPFDLLAGFAGSFTGPPILSPGIDRGEQQIGRARRVPIEARSVAFRESLVLLYLDQ